MEEFPSNSRKAINDRTEPATDANKETVEKVVTGKVLRRKKPLGRRLKEMFFSGDSNSVVGYLLKEVLVPAMQVTVMDLVTQGVEKAVYGEVRTQGRTTRPGSATRTHISYDRFGNSSSRPEPRSNTRSRSSYMHDASDVGEILVDSRIEADRILSKLVDRISKYDAATVADMKHMIEETSEYTDEYYGWTDLRGSVIRRVRDGYVLILPEPEDLKQ